MSGRVEVIACSTCGGSERDESGRSQGEQLAHALDAALVEEAPEQHARAIDVSTVRCLWACTNRCTVHIRQEGKVGYVIGRLAPSAETARALLDYAKLYAESAEGAVPFKQSPALLRGHFLCRVPRATPVVSPASADDARKD